MSSSMASNSSMSERPYSTSDEQIPEKPPGSSDVGWNYGKLVKKDCHLTVQCKKCMKVMKGGVNRLKQHIAGIGGEVKGCPLASDEDRRACRQNLDAIKMRKNDKKKAEYEMRQEVRISDEREEEAPELASIGSKKPRVSGPLDKMVADGKMKQTVLNETERRQWRDLAHEKLSMWAYAAGLPFHVFDMEEFDIACEAIGRYGPGYKGPSQYQFRVPLLKKACDKIEGGLEKQKQWWDEYGCSILTDGWTDRRHRSVMNLCVHCKEGTSFIKSIEDSEHAHTGNYIYKWVEDCIMEVGESRVVQVVTDNAASNMAAKNKLKDERPNIFWTSCAAHTIDLMLEDIGKLLNFKTVIDKARNLTVFLYLHHSTLSLMRKFTNRRELVRPGVTRFATSFLSLTCLVEKKPQLAAMVSSPEWEENRWAKTSKGVATKSTVYSDSFWKDTQLLIKIYAPLFKLLRIVDADRRPSMGFVYGMLEDAKNEIKSACNRKVAVYQPIVEIIEKHAAGRLDSPLHLAAYFLNPYYYYRDKTPHETTAARSAIYHCLDVFFREMEEVQDKIAQEEMVKYKNAEGLMGSGLSKRYYMSFNGTDNFDPSINVISSF